MTTAIGNTTEYHRLTSEILGHLEPKDREGTKALETQLVKHLLDRKIRQWDDPVSREERMRIPGIKNKKVTVYCGGGKDSEFVLTMARALQLMILEDYGETFRLRVAVGRQPGMLKPVFDNLDRCFTKLKLEGDDRTDLFYVDGYQSGFKFTPYVKNAGIPDALIDANRTRVLLSGHLFSGAGRRTFCDDCNQTLAGWIASAQAYNGGTDLYLTGDSKKELNAQSRTGIPRMARELGAPLPEAGLAPVKKSLVQIQLATNAFTHKKYKDAPSGTDGLPVGAPSVPAADIPDNIRFVSLQPHVRYESKYHPDLLNKFLDFKFDSLMFSFTETDCGNPALMCHLYGLIGEQIAGASYTEGVQAFLKHAIPIMEQKGFTPEYIREMQDRYGSDEKIHRMRGIVEDYAREAYHLEPEQLAAMVFAPFTGRGRNLHAYLEHLGKATLKSSEGRIKLLLNGTDKIHQSDRKLIKQLQDATGLNLDQMRWLYKNELQYDNFHPGDEKALARLMNENDKPYTSRQKIGKDTYTITAR